MKGAKTFPVQVLEMPDVVKYTNVEANVEIIIKNIGNIWRST